MKTQKQMQAEKFLKDTNTKMWVSSPEWRTFYHYKECNYVTRIRLMRDGQSFSFLFGQMQSTRPTALDVLSCLMTEIFDYSEFCSMFGYDEYDKKNEYIWNNCTRQAEKTISMFGDCLKELREVQD